MDADTVGLCADRGEKDMIMALRETATARVMDEDMEKRLGCVVRTQGELCIALGSRTLC